MSLDLLDLCHIVEKDYHLGSVLDLRGLNLDVLFVRALPFKDESLPLLVGLQIQFTINEVPERLIVGISLPWERICLTRLPVKTRRDLSRLL